MKHLIALIFTFCFSTMAFANYHKETILQTFWSPQTPLGKKIELKNADVLFVHDNYSGMNKQYYALHLYFWVKRGLDEENLSISIINVNDMKMQPQSIERVGVDGEDYFVYKASYVLNSQNYRCKFYGLLTLVEERREYYSNETEPNSFFEFQFNLSPITENLSYKPRRY